MNAEFWNNKKVFITGHSGFKGRWLVHWLLKNNAIVWVRMPGDYPCDDFDNQVSMIYCKGKEKGLWHTPLHVIDYPVSKDIPSWNFKTDK